MQRPTQELIQEWKSVYEQYKSLLSANFKSVPQVIEFLQQKYPLQEDISEKFKNVVVANITMNEPFAAKIPNGKELNPMAFVVPNKGTASNLYKKRHEIYSDSLIIIGMEFESGYIFVEGSDDLKDEITAFQGLDKDDLHNYYLVANYIRCLKKHNLLNLIR